MRLPILSRQEGPRRERSKCKRGTARNGRKSGSRIQARGSRKRRARASSTPFLRPRKLAKERDKDSPSPAPWWWTNTAAPFISKPKKARGRPSSSASPKRAQVVRRRGPRREAHLVRGRREQNSRRHTT